MRVFWSWQNDSNPTINRHLIRDALANAIEQAGKELGLEDAERPEIDHDTKGTPGMAEITNTILRKISESAVFVADLTPIGETTGGKALPNPNVLIELGWALRELGGDRIIAILNTANGYTPDDLPFDIRHRRALTYALSEGASKAERTAIQKKLTSDLAGALTTNLGQYSADQAAAAPIESIPAKDSDPSVWSTFNGGLDYFDSSNTSRTVAVPDEPRAYIRIIPSGWKDDIPAIAAIENAQEGEKVWPAAEGSRSGDCGPCEEGFVRFWSAGEKQSRNVTMWFDETGEFWVIHGTATGEWKNGKSMLRIDAVLRAWRTNLRNALRALDRFGALPARRVEAGLVGIKGTMWPAEMISFSVPARKNQTIIECQQRDWSDEAQLRLLTDAYNKIRDNFSLPHVEENDLRKILQEH